MKPLPCLLLLVAACLPHAAAGAPPKPAPKPVAPPGQGGITRALHRKIAMEAGFVLHPHLLAAHRSPEVAENAAPLWADFARGLTEAPVPDPTQNAILASDAASNPDTLRALRTLVEERRALLDLAAAAATKAECRFPRDWAGVGPSTAFPEYATLRTAARLLLARAYVLAADRRSAEAAAALEQAFVAARHAGSDPGVLAHLASTGIHGTVLGGAEALLRARGSEPGMPELLAAVLARHEAPPDWAAALKTEAALLRPLLGRIAAEGPGAALPAGPEERPARPGFGPRGLPATVTAMTAAQRTAWHDFCGHAEADFLRQLVALASLAGKPPHEQVKGARAAEDRLSLPARADARDAWSRALLPPLLRLPEVACRAATRHRLALAAAAVVAYRNRQGQYPSSLDGARPASAEDPYTGQLLRYRRESGGFLLFSRGPTGLFDGGTETAPVPRGELIFRYRGP